MCPYLEEEVWIKDSCHEKAEKSFGDAAKSSDPGSLQIKDDGDGVGTTPELPE